MSRRVFFVLALFASAATFAGGVDFTLNDVDGRKHSLSDYRGKWVVVNYWATWCPPCREEMPELIHFHENHKNKDAVVLGINMEETSRERLLRFMEDYLVTYPILRSEPDMAALGPVSGLPTTYLVSPEGVIVAQQVGPVTEQDIESFLGSYSKKK